MDKLSNNLKIYATDRWMSPPGTTSITFLVILLLSLKISVDADKLWDERFNFESKYGKGKG